VELADYDPGILDTNVMDDGRQYGVPWYVDTRLLFYRRDLLARAGHDAPPRDWDAWLRMLTDVQERAGASGPMDVIVVEDEGRDDAGGLVFRTRATLILRRA
jgi:ABC-type glycerol-3-phosphate transport system substrate-binding protein